MSTDVRLSWTQPCCERCWIDREGTWEIDEAEGFQYLAALRQPVRMVRDEAVLERCSFCGGPTFIGIYVRVDPATVPYPAVKSDDE